ncbi:MAG: phosphotransferase [Polyangiales bacterium]
MSRAPTPCVPADVLARYGLTPEVAPRRFGTGLINDTFLADAPSGRVVIQRLHPVFSPRVHEDIDAVTRHLTARGVLTPTLLRTLDGALWVEREGEVWRAQTFVAGGESFDRVPSVAMAREAGALVGRFHAAVADLDHAYRAVRVGVHDTARHLQRLRDALDAHRDHALYAEVSALAAPLLDAARALPDLSALATRHAHGDLKFSNLLFDAEGRGLCLVDLDTLARMPLAHELGDALRSWCNPAGEDVANTAVDAAVLEAALEGYASSNPALTDDERGSVVDGLTTIALELAARFACDALEERYFGWDAARFDTRGEHNLLRARGQWALARDALSRRDALAALAGRALRG